MTRASVYLAWTLGRILYYIGRIASLLFKPWNRALERAYEEDKKMYKRQLYTGAAMLYAGVLTAPVYVLTKSGFAGTLLALSAVGVGLSTFATILEVLTSSEEEGPMEKPLEEVQKEIFRDQKEFLNKAAEVFRRD